ncbi:MAG: hypothetical protein K9M40_03070 [Candidatus Pacebacteria bacterium]|nr:hypothetical protein [Candidatus Paceibacterota bacterium]
MLGQKLFLLRKHSSLKEEEIFENPFTDDIQNFKKTIKQNIRKYIYLSLFTILHFYIHFSKLLKKKSLELAKKIEEKLLKSQGNISKDTNESQEVNKYLKMISDYQKKIRGAGRKTKEE